MIATFNLFVNTYFQKIYSIKFYVVSLNFTIRLPFPFRLPFHAAHLAACSIYDLFAPPKTTYTELLGIGCFSLVEIGCVVTDACRRTQREVARTGKTMLEVMNMP